MKPLEQVCNSICICNAMTIRTVNYPADRRPDRKKLWLAAVKPPMYSVAILPILMGTVIAFAETGTFQAGIFSIFVFSAILILAWENISNDVFDSETGADVNKHHSLVNLTDSKHVVFWLGNMCLATGLFGIGAIATIQGNFVVAGLILGCCVLGYVYQGPPFRLGYKGWGEILCFLAFGPLAFAAVYYSQTKAFSGTSFAASSIVGISTSLILFCSHFHQVEDDAVVGKRSPVVRLGTKRSAQLLPWLVGSIFGLTTLFVLLVIFPIWTLLIFASLPIARKLCEHVSANHNQPEQVSNCKFIAVSLHFWSGIFLSIGFLLPSGLSGLMS